MYVIRAQKLPKKIVEKAGIPDAGCGGLRLGAEGPSASAHTTRHRTMAALASTCWPGERSSQARICIVGQLVLIVLRESNDSTMQVLFEI